ncbi:hypothetical protein HDU91_002734 [Kappamyces sp. JEL0680]|nr:hypothetical protein HDU91_002734 [Kappamyces sp. JEL0680]
MSSFSKTIHGETSKHYLSLLAILVKDPLFAREFMRFNGLRSLLTLMKIPHMDVVFQSVRILRTLAAQGKIAESEFGNSTRQQLIGVLACLTSTTHTEAEVKIKAKKVVKKEIAGIFKIPKPAKEESQGAMLTKALRLAEERKKLASTAEKTAIAAVEKQEPKIVRPKPAESSSSRSLKKRPDSTKQEKPAKPKRNLAKSPAAESSPTPVSAPNKDEQPSGGIISVAKPIEDSIIDLLERLDLTPDLPERAAILALVAKEIIQKPLSTVMGDIVCKALVPCFQWNDANVTIQCCTIAFYLISQEELHETLFFSGFLQQIIKIVDGYNLTAIGFALQSLDRYCSAPTNIGHVCELHILDSLGIVVDSGIEKIRNHSQSILAKIAKHGDATIRDQLRELNYKNPWSMISKAWSNDSWSFYETSQVA